MGALAECSNAEEGAKYASTAVEAAMAGLDDLGDRRDEVAIESIVALNGLVARAEDSQLAAILPAVLLKVRPCFEKESARLRAASFSLFGELGARVGEAAGEEFATQLHANLVALLLHLDDDDDVVKEKCARTLYLLKGLLTAPIATAILEDRLGEQRGSRTPVANYPAFIQDFATTMALSFPDRVNSYALGCSNYFKAASGRIRANAAQFIGCLLGALTPQLRATVSKDLIFAGLVLLLSDEDVTVRIATAKAIARLHAFP